MSKEYPEHWRNPKLTDLLAPSVVKRWTLAEHYGTVSRYIVRQERPRLARVSKVLDRFPALSGRHVKRLGK